MALLREAYAYGLGRGLSGRGLKHGQMASKSVREWEYVTGRN